jgi:predicted nuclease of restriction endonuclease-like (RecB) superfamily
LEFINRLYDLRKTKQSITVMNMKDLFLTSPEYSEFIAELKARVLSARISAARAVNRDVILLYWDIGRGIVKKQKALGWGKSVVETVAKDLQKAFPAMIGFSSSNLWRMRQLFLGYSAPDFLAHLVPELSKPRGVAYREQESLNKGINSGARQDEQILAQAVPEFLAACPWGHHVELLKKVKEPAARCYYLRATIQFGWTRNVLLNQIKAAAYERAVTGKKAHNFPAVLPDYLAEQAQETLKSSYCLEFLGVEREIKERELEDRLIEKLKEFILELGYGFCFVGRQYRLTLKQKEYFIDLLFYHRFLKALVAFELKVGSFEPEYAGKMDFYLNLLNDKERAADDNPSIGIILCAEKDDIEVEYALKTKRNPIGVAVYQLQSKLPSNLRGKLPSERELSAAVRTVLPQKKGG